MMALMPVTCEKIHKIIPIINAFRIPGFSISEKEFFSIFNASLISANSSVAFEEPLIFVRINFASSQRCFWASHLGLSGTKNKSNKKIMEGKIPEPNIHLHPVDTFHASSYHPAMDAFTK